MMLINYHKDYHKIVIVVSILGSKLTVVIPYFFLVFIQCFSCIFLFLWLIFCNEIFFVGFNATCKVKKLEEVKISTVYFRWGRKTCPKTAKRVFMGKKDLTYHLWKIIIQFFNSFIRILEIAIHVQFVFQ